MFREIPFNARRIDPAACLFLQILVPSDMVRMGMRVIDSLQGPSVCVQNPQDLFPGIPVIAANSDIEGTRRLCYVGQDGLRASRVAGRTMGNFLRGRGRIAIISSAIDNENNSYHVKVREDGFRGFLRETFPEIEIVASVESYEDPEITYRETYNLLKKYPDLDGLYITCGGVGQVGRAIRDCGREDIKALSFEKYPEILDLMQEDIIDCTIDSELERQGEIPVQIIMDQLVLKKAPPEQNIYTDIRILIKECLF